MGAIVTLEPPADLPVSDLPWIIAFGPLVDDEEWEPVVCGPYPRPHALALARSVVADDDLIAVVEPVRPHLSVEAIRGEIAAARLAAAKLTAGTDSAADDDPPEDVDEADQRIVPSVPPSPEQVRAGFARIAAQLIAA